MIGVYCDHAIKMELPDLTCPYPGRLQKTDGRIGKVEVRHDIIDYRAGLVNRRFVDVFLPSHRLGSWG